MKTGDILACRGNKLLAKLIMKFTDSKWSHVAIVVNIDDDIYVAEMQKNGCNLISLENWTLEYNYYYEVYSPTEKVSLKKILSKTGITRYDKVSLLIRQPFKIIKEKLFKKSIRLKQLEKEQTKMTCSEFVAWLYNFENSQDYTPDDVIKECIKNNWI